MEAKNEKPLNMRAAGITLTLAALVIAILAVTFTAGQADATTTNIAPSGDYNSIPQPQEATATATPTATPTPPRHKTPEACPGDESRPDDEAASVIDSGQYALFDVYWNPVEGELTNTVCPPRTEYARAGFSGGITRRSESSIDITAEPPTIIHIPSSAMVDLSTTTEYTQARYPAVWIADGAENRPNAEGTPVPGKGDRKVWVLPPCPHVGNVAAVGDLCLSFSSVLLKSADWKPNTKIKFHLDHVHQKDLDRQLPRYTLAYDVRPGSTAAPGGFLPEWNSQNAKVAVMGVAPGRYEHPTWIFTSRGTYDLQVHITGEPSSALGVAEPSVNSDQQKYILHVGAEADLSVGVTAAPTDATDTSLDPGDDVTITVTASNAAGKDAAPETKVDVNLPEGLTYSSHVAATGTTYDSATGVWAWNEDISLASGASKTLTITATVDAETHGQTLSAKATISATEPVKVTETVDGVETEVEHHVPVPDPDPDNDMDTATVMVARKANVDAMFRVTRSVNENSPSGTAVGEPVVASDPDDSELDYWLTGRDSAKFDVNNQGQIVLSECGVLDYETQASYNLKLNVSDGRDEDGNNDPADSRIVDHNIGVLVQVVDVQGDSDVAPSPVLNLTSDAGSNSVASSTTVTFTANPSNLSDCSSQNLVYSWYERFPNESNVWVLRARNAGNTFESSHIGPQPVEIQARTDVQGETVSSDAVRITWLAP